MSAPTPHEGAPVHIHRHNHVDPPPVGKSATASGLVALLLSLLAIIATPLLILIPYVGFLPALLAGAGILVAWAGLHGSTASAGVAVAGLIVSVLVFALLAGVATMWHFLVADPAIRDYAELHEVVEWIRGLVT